LSEERFDETFSHETINECFDTIVKGQLKISGTSCLEFNVKNLESQLSIENALKILEAFNEKEIFFVFRSPKENSFAVYWQLKDAKRLLCLKCEADEEFLDFLKQFLIESSKKKLSGEFDAIYS
jgi:hypothetical protein